MLCWAQSACSTRSIDTLAQWHGSFHALTDSQTHLAALGLAGAARTPWRCSVHVLHAWRPWEAEHCFGTQGDGDWRAVTVARMLVVDLVALKWSEQDAGSLSVGWRGGAVASQFTSYFYLLMKESSNGKGENWWRRNPPRRLPSKALPAALPCFSLPKLSLERQNVSSSICSSFFTLNLNLTLSCAWQHLLLAHYAYSCVCEPPE